MNGIFYKIKKIIPFFVLTLLLSCSGDPKLSDNPNTTFDDFRSFLNENFLDISESKKLSESIGALVGASFKSVGLNIEAYRFDEKKKVKEGEIAIATMLKAFDLNPLECLVSGYFLICSADEGEFQSKGLLSKF